VGFILPETQKTEQYQLQTVSLCYQYDGGTVLVWTIDPASWASRICGMVGRNLTHDEWNG
jgi:hypothetical protein